MSRILVIEDEDMIRKFLNEVAKENIIRISNVSVNLLQYEDIIINTDSYEVFKNGKKVELTIKEYQILKLLMENPNKVFSREYIIEKIWKYDFAGEEQVIYSHIKNIRRKVGENVIKTVRGIGYKI